MRQQKTVNVGGTEYLLTQYSALQGLKYQKALAKLILPALTELQKAEQEGNAMVMALSKIAENLDELDETMIKSMVEQGATKGNMSINFDSEFAGNYGNLFKLVQELIVFNFESVFTVFGSELQNS